MRIDRFDENDFLRSGPAFELLLTANCFVDVVVGLPVEQALHVVFVGEAFATVKFVFKRALVQVAGDASVECARQRLPMM